MSVNITTAFVQQFSSTVQLLLQQKDFKFGPHITMGNHIGKQASPVDQIGAIAMQPVVGRFGPIGRVDASLDRRWVLPQDFDLNQLLDSFDEHRLLIDPKSKYLENARAAANRKKDEVMVAALFGTALTGETASTSTTFPSANQVAVNFESASNTGLTVAKLREAKRLLMSYEVDLDSDPLCAVVTSNQYDDLLREMQVVSTDFNDKPVLVDGKITRFLGINIIHCERLGVDGSSYRRVPVFAKSGLYMGMWNDVQADIDRRKDLSSQPWQAYIKMTIGATRLEENKMIEIKCAE